ncbi:MAG: TIGR02996 domain-containing protein [Mariniblastus sp.]
MSNDRDENDFLQLIHSDQHDDERWLVFADWLEDRGDERADYVRLRLLMNYLLPDDVNREIAEIALSKARVKVDDSWLRKIEPDLRRFRDIEIPRFGCKCSEAADNWFHCEAQDTECDEWKRFCEVIDKLADVDGEAGPLSEIDWGTRNQIVTLPSSIKNMKSIRRLNVYGSGFSRIPPEIGELCSMRQFDPYTSYSLHWLPFELNKCQSLVGSTVSTRALYGNYKNRMEFPDLRRCQSIVEKSKTYSHFLAGFNSERICSVCESLFEDYAEHKVWISLLKGGDVWPFLVNACSAECLANLPKPAEGYVETWHRGGSGLKQPES